MCYFVFISVSSDKAVAVTSLESTTLLVRPISIPSINVLFPKGHAVFEVTNGACSCSLYPNNQGNRTEAKRRAKYEQKSWSASKIERALSSKRQRDSKKRNIGRTFDNFLDDLVNTVGEIGFFAHWFKGSTADELLTSLYTLERYADRDWDYPLDTLMIVRAGAG